MAFNGHPASANCIPPASVRLGSSSSKDLVDNPLKIRQFDSDRAGWTRIGEQLFWSFEAAEKCQKFRVSSRGFNGSFLPEHRDGSASG